MNYHTGNSKLSLAECRKIAAKHGIPYTDEELIQMRDWLDNLGDIILTIVEQNGVDAMNEIIERENRIKDESS
jgi:hypothetical protein